MRDRSNLISVARGDREPELVIEGARVFSAFTKEWLEGDVGISDGRIAGVGSFEGGTRMDAAGLFLVPGFIDAHVHIESSKLTVDEFARTVLPHGTTAVVSDPHEIANVLGIKGIDWLLQASEGLPVEVFVMAPSCVPASRFESPRQALSVDDIEAMLERDRVLGVAEMMNFGAVIAGDAAELEKLRARGASHADGHAPGLTGRALDAYIAAGIRSDHESTSYGEAIEKRRKGMWVLIREASNARNLVDLLPLVRALGADRCAFCTDDREPDLLLREGHINQMCRIAVGNGIPAEDALLLASLNPARCHGLEGMGAVAPGFKADLCLLPDLEEFRPVTVVKAGRVVAEQGRALPFPRRAVPTWVRETMQNAPVRPGDLAVAATGKPIRVIEVVEDQLLTRARVEQPKVNGRMVVGDPDRDLAKICVVERHHASGRIGKGFVTGFGLQHGAFASTVAHDAHNIVVVGVADDDMATCIAALEEMGGGIVAVEDGRVSARLALPIGGLLSDEPVEEVVMNLDRLHGAVAQMGVKLSSPFMTLSFLALSVIPALKLTDRGLVDVDRFELVSLEVDRR